MFPPPGRCTPRLGGVLGSGGVLTTVLGGGVGRGCWAGVLGGGAGRGSWAGFLVSFCHGYETSSFCPLQEYAYPGWAGVLGGVLGGVCWVGVLDRSASLVLSPWV